MGIIALVVCVVVTALLSAHSAASTSMHRVHLHPEQAMA